MRVKVLHSVALRQSAVQVFDKNEMKVMSHIVGVENIPSEWALPNQDSSSSNVRKPPYSWLIKAVILNAK